MQRPNIDLTYGEILPQSISKLLHYLQLDPDDVFLDLGAGKGKLALQVFKQSHAQKVYGIEIMTDLHAQAIAALNTLKRQQPELFYKREFHLIQADFLQLELPTATHVLLGSPCFSPLTLHKLSQKIAATPSIHTIISLRPLPYLRRFQFSRMMRLQCSWDSAMAFVYQDPQQRG